MNKILHTLDEIRQMNDLQLTELYKQSQFPYEKLKGTLFMEFIDYLYDGDFHYRCREASALVTATINEEAAIRWFKSVNKENKNLKGCKFNSGVIIHDDGENYVTILKVKKDTAEILDMRTEDRIKYLHLDESNKVDLSIYNEQLKKMLGI